MIDEIAPSNLRFEFQVTKDEDKLFRTLVGKKLKTFLDRRIHRMVAVVAFVIVVTSGYIALDRGWLTPRVMFMSILSFVLGEFYMFFMSIWPARRMFDRMFELDQIGEMRWHVVFDDFSIIVRTPNVESRMCWDGIAEVEDSETIVVIWYNSRQGFYIPARVFADTSARTAFTKWASEHVRRAKALSASTTSASATLAEN
ncbi:YcxB family protein [Bradyrhizobium sp. INPA01-394B]|uniref:YcxB family protein n=1 Tax=Bradyrhizobium campsiandrae TaxID=1729892 RepID=A0ABR7UAG6_9BRAD|nr:YcxB family protein [Bradyrhizobium campsiandrae]MBC9880479.1 YcxB family protein [Bradyrhizobium campsiandrae]MBC9980962.1 YcxB family protein [Bradyrhizobium campsiandrae]